MASKQIRPIRVEGNVAYVPLTKGYEAIIDVADVHLVAGFNWCARVDKRTVYAMRGDCSGPKTVTLFLHHAIMGRPQGMEIDHADCNGLNNRRDNLRVATKGQNQHNRRIDVDNTSGFKGVSWHPASGKWMARISCGGKERYLGVYDRAEDAAARVSKERTSLHGHFSRAS